MFRFALLCLGVLSFSFSTAAVANVSSNAQPNSGALTPVKLQLKWQHQFQFAGYYAAIEKGFYHQAGLDVSLIEAGIGTDSIKAVLAGEAEFGVGTSEVLLNYHQGDPVVVLAAIMQHSPLALATLKSLDITNIHQLASERMMIEPSSLELFAYLKNEGVDLQRLQQVEHYHQIQDLIDGHVKSMSIYTTDEPFEFAAQGIDVQLFRPIMAGIDFYGDNLFTTQQMVKQHPRLVEAFRQASLQGWQYAMQHPDEIIELIRSRYSARKSHAHLTFEAEKMRELMKPDLVELGYMNPGRWQHIAHTYYQLGLLPEKFATEGMLYQTRDFAYQRLKQQLYYALAFILIVGLLAAVFYRQYHLANLRRQQFEALFLNAPVCLMEIDEQGKIYHWNREAEKTFQYLADEAIGQNAFDLLLAQPNLTPIQQVIHESLLNNQITYSENENRRKDGQSILCLWSNMPIETGRRHNKRVICMAQDITQEKQMEQKLYTAAHYDDLTGLPNRVLILQLLKNAIADAKRHHSMLAILFIDLNGFKAINDTHGHLVGDLVLQQTAQRIQQALREKDLVGRLSGDEFLVVVKDLKEPLNLQTVQNNILTAIERNLTVNTLSLNIGASIGSSFYPQDAEDIQHLISLADQAMYKVKADGKAKKLTKQPD